MHLPSSALKGAYLSVSQNLETLNFVAIQITPCISPDKLVEFHVSPKSELTA